MADQTNEILNVYALLIGIDHYLPNQLPGGVTYRNLKGCVRDINHVEAFLKTTFNLPDEKLFKLIAPNPESSPEPSGSQTPLPTYENIVGTFKKLTDEVPAGAQVYIHYSGHGGRTTTVFPNLKGDGGIDEALVPTDIGNSEGRYLRDIELAHLLQKMVDKGLVVTVVLDSCHSGGSTRAGDSDIRGADMDVVDTIKRPPAESLVASVEELEKTWQSLVEDATRKGEAVTSMLPEAKGYVLLAACRQNEFAYEYAFNGKERNGALTYWLLDSLKNRDANLNYKVLYDRLIAKIQSQFQQQTPMLLGEGDRLVLSSGSGSYQNAILVMEVDTAKNRVRLGAGQAHGLSEGAQFVIYPQGVSDLTQEEKQLAIFQVSEIQAVYCWADKVKTLRDGEIEQGAQAVLLAAPVDLIRRIRLVECTNKNTAPEKLPPAEIDQKVALKAVEQALTGNGWVKLVANDEAAHYQVSINKQGEYEICEPTGDPIPQLGKSLKVSDTGAAPEVVKRLVHLTKYKATEELDNFTPLATKLVVELVGKQKDYRAGKKPAPEPFTNPLNGTVQHGEHVFLHIRNNHSQVFNVAVLDLDLNWSISQLDPMGDGSLFVPVEPGEAGELLIPIRMTVPEGYEKSRDIFKVFATVGPANFGWLELPPLDQPLRNAGERGLEKPTNQLDALFAAIGADEPPAMRVAEVITDPSRGWVTKQVTVNITKA